MTARLSIFALLTLIFVGSSCDVSKRAIRKHERIVKRFPEVHQQDTIIVRDTLRVMVPEVKTDTIVHVDQLYDTIEVEKERLKIRVYRVLDSVFIEGKCDTIEVEKIIERRVPIRYYKTESSWLKYVIIAGIVIFTLYALIRKRDERTDR